jgi:hypothetical protein
LREVPPVSSDLIPFNDETATGRIKTQRDRNIILPQARLGAVDRDGLAPGTSF